MSKKILITTSILVSLIFFVVGFFVASLTLKQEVQTPVSFLNEKDCSFTELDQRLERIGLSIESLEIRSSSGRITEINGENIKVQMGEDLGEKNIDISGAVLSKVESTDPEQFQTELDRFIEEGGEFPESETKTEIDISQLQEGVELTIVSEQDLISNDNVTASEVFIHSNN